MLEKKEYKRLDELGHIGRGKSRHRPRNDPSLYGGKYPFIQTGDVKASEFCITQYEQTYNEKGLAQSKIWPKGTLCITIAANIAETTILGIEACFPDSIVGFIPDKDKADVRFVKYYIDTIKLNMQQISGGTTQDNLCLEKLLSFKIVTPHLSIQKKIASILSAYDDLIDNSTSRIKILEEMAQMLYLEWFVKFKFPGHEKVKMVESELGMIPEEWEIHLVSDVVKRLKAGAKYTQDNVLSIGNIPVVDQSTNEFLGYHNNTPDHYASSDKPTIIFGDHTCKMRLMVKPFSVGPNVIPFVSENGVPVHFLYYTIYNLVETREYKRHWNDLMVKKILIPTSELMLKFSSFVVPIFQTRDNNSSKNIILRRTRDLLLPKLVSGELDVENLDIDVGGD